MLAVALRQTVPFQQGHVVGCQAAFARPHHRDPFPGARLRHRAPPCDAPCARSWHALPRVACRRASQESPPGRPRPLVAIAMNAGIPGPGRPQGRGSYAVLVESPLTASGEMLVSRR